MSLTTSHPVRVPLPDGVVRFLRAPPKFSQVLLEIASAGVGLPTVAAKELLGLTLRSPAGLTPVPCEGRLRVELVVATLEVSLPVSVGDGS